MTTAAFDPASATIAIVTYNRSGLLTRLLESIVVMDPKPGHVVIIDNASVDDTTEVVESFRDRIGTELVYHRLDTNTGGSGGFSEGMRVAYELGSTWMWLMDDDVEVIPDGLAKMGEWAPRFKSIQGRRYDYDGSEFYWQYRAGRCRSASRSRSPLRASTSRGYQGDELRMLRGHVHPPRHRRRDRPARPAVLHLLGRPALRLARLAQDDSVIVDEFVLRRTREIKQWDMGIRHLNASSDAYRYYIMRNRGAHQAVLPARTGSTARCWFGAGTALTFAKELIRLLFVERKVRGTSNLFRGIRDGREIARDATWQPMPPLDVRAGSAGGVVRVVAVEHLLDRAHPWPAGPCRGTGRACRSGAGRARCG